MSVVLDDYGNEHVVCCKCGLQQPAKCHLQRGWRWIALPNGEVPICAPCWEWLAGRSREESAT